MAESNPDGKLNESLCTRRTFIKGTAIAGLLFAAGVWGGDLLEETQDKVEWSPEKSEQWLKDVQNDLKKDITPEERYEIIDRLISPQHFPDYQVKYNIKRTGNIVLNPLESNPDRPIDPRANLDFVRHYDRRLEDIYHLATAKTMSEIALFESTCPNSDIAFEIRILLGMSHRVNRLDFAYRQNWYNMILAERPNLFDDINKYLNTKPSPPKDMKLAAEIVIKRFGLFEKIRELGEEKGK